MYAPAGMYRSVAACSLHPDTSGTLANYRRRPKPIWKILRELSYGNPYPKNRCVEGFFLIQPPRRDPDSHPLQRVYFIRIIILPEPAPKGSHMKVYSDLPAGGWLGRGGQLKRIVLIWGVNRCTNFRRLARRISTQLPHANTLRLSLRFKRL